MDTHSNLASAPGQGECSSLGLFDTERMAVFRIALENILHTEAAEAAFSELIDGLPTKETLLKFNTWEVGHPIDVLNHVELCAGSREKARRFRDEFDVYVLSFPEKVCMSPMKRGTCADILHCSSGPPGLSKRNARDQDLSSKLDRTGSQGVPSDCRPPVPA